jgi:hypothetical protein
MFLNNPWRNDPEKRHAMCEAIESAVGADRIVEEGEAAGCHSLSIDMSG